MNMNKDEAKKYHGYLALPRHSKMLQQNLGYFLFSLYIALVMDARWHRNNPQIGSVIGTQTEIAFRLGISQSTLSRGIDKLCIKNRYYAIKNKKYILLGFFPLFLIDVASKMDKKEYASLQGLYADMYRINAELQENYAVSQEKRGQNAPQRLYRSYNVDSDSSQGDNQEEIDIDEVAEGIGKTKEEGSGAAL